MSAMCDNRMTNNERFEDLTHTSLYFSMHIEYCQSFDHPWSVKCIRKRTYEYKIFACALPKYNNDEYLYLRVVVVSIARTQWPQPLQLPLVPPSNFSLPCIALACHERIFNSTG